MANVIVVTAGNVIKIRMITDIISFEYYCYILLKYPTMSQKAVTNIIASKGKRQAKIILKYYGSVFTSLSLMKQSTENRI
jgi:hypothetical protein